MKKEGLDPSTLNWLYPIVALECYPKSAITVRMCREEVRRGTAPRGEVKKLTKKSLSRLVFYVANSTVKMTSFITLTYGVNYPVDGKRAKKGLNSFLVQSRRMWRKYSYVWFIEFQRRGAPHFHILTDLPAPSKSESVLRSEFAELWARIAEPGDCLYSKLETQAIRYSRGDVTRVHLHRDAWQPIRCKDGAARYVAKYATKPRQKIVPKEYRNVGRFWGMSRDVSRSIPEPKVVLVRDTSEAQEYISTIYGRDTTGFDFLPKIIYL